MGEARTVEEFGNIIIAKRQNAGQIWRQLRLKDVARIEDALNKRPQDFPQQRPERRAWAS